MEQSLKSVGNNISDNKSHIPAAYSSNRIKENVVFRHHRKPITTFSSSVVNGYKGQSLNKIQSMKTNKKIDIIKLKCMQKPVTKPLQKNIIQAKWIEDQPMNISFDLQDQTDDAILQKNDIPQVYLRQSKFNGRPPTVHFRYPKCCGIQQKQDSKIFILQKKNLYYKFNGSQYRCIVNSLEYNGFQKCEYGSEWNIYFDIKGTKLKKIQHMSKYQKINHFPGCWYIGRKDFLWRGINKMRRSHPQAFNFVPMTYLLPSDFDRFEMAKQNAQKNQLWILKPSAAACGRGIKMISKDTKIKNRKEYLISEYISNPHLINNFKYDLRIYILVTSYDPLRIYFFQQGLVRFATYEYNCKLKDIKKRFMHLTNFSVNKHSKRFVKNSKAQIDGQGSKWSLKALKRYYQNNGIDVNQVFKRIEDVIIKTCISAEPNMLDIHSKTQQKRSCGFQIYGFDILMDSNLKPWLMQVNVCPSLSSSSLMDRKIKHTLLTDVLNLIGIEYHKDQEKLKKKLKQNNFYHMQSSRKLYSKNINTIQQLNFNNCIQMLSPEDWLILFESEQQLDRLGHFKRIFPVQNNISNYQKLFQYKRYNNIILWKYLESCQNFFDHLYQF